MSNDVYRELLLGCGHRREKLMGIPGRPLEWQNLFTLDNNLKCEPDYECDLNYIANGWRLDQRVEGKRFEEIVEGPARPIRSRFMSDIFDEIHAYEVIEHLGQQGDARSFFDFFTECWRILKPDGYLFATCPSRYSPWLWGDPSHRRAIQPESLVFLSQENYKKQCDGPNRTPMSDFRHIYTADFDIVHSSDNHTSHMFCLKAVKPSRFGT